jgi:site-specific DNA recombinase
MSSRIALYARVSSDHQAHEGTIDSQVASLRAYCVEYQYRVEEDLIFCDNGVSGTTLARRGLDALRDKAVAGEVDIVLVWCPDRLARKHTHQLLLVEEFHRLGVEIKFANHAIAQTPEDQLLFHVQGVIAEFEREKILERSRRGKLHRARNGKVSALAQAPYGYVYLRAMNRDETRYEIHPHEAEVVRQIFTWFTEEHLSIDAIARRLTREQIPTRHQHGGWNASVLWNLLRNPAYMGRAAYQKTQVVPRTRVIKSARERGYYPKHVNSSCRPRPRDEWIYIPVPAIVSPSLFQRAQTQLAENKKFAARHRRPQRYLLSGLLHCQRCGYALYGKPSQHEKEAARQPCYYRCKGQDGYRFVTGRVCQGRPLRVELLEEVVWIHLKELLQHPEVVLAEYTQRVNAQRTGSAMVEALLRKKQKESRQQENEKQRLLDLYQAGSISLEEIAPRLQDIRARIKSIEGEVKRLEHESQQQDQHLRLVEQFAVFQKKIGQNLDHLSFEDKRRILQLLVTEIAVDSVQGEITIKHILPLDETLPLHSGSHAPSVVCASASPWAARVFSASTAATRSSAHTGAAEANNNITTIRSCLVLIASYFGRKGFSFSEERAFSYGALADIGGQERVWGINVTGLH